jgi:uncharacterized protein (DUF2141 family)
MQHLPLLAVLGMAILSAAPAAAINLTVTVTGIRNDHGKIAALAFSNKQGFPDDPARALAQAVVDARKGSVTLTLKNLPAGPLAVAVLHDENANGKLNRNIFGLPLEGVGMSRNPVGKSAPTFAHAVMAMDQSCNLDITLKYW